MNETPGQILQKFFIDYGILTIVAVFIGVVLWNLLDYWPTIRTAALILLGIVFGWIGGNVWREDFGD